MKNSLVQEKGISMIALVITIIILIILTSMLVYNAQDNVYIRKLENLYNDIEILRDKVSEYYNEYGEIPAKVKYTNISSLSNVLSSKNDIGDFYVIDLEAMKGITLNYGKEYEDIKKNPENADNYTDIYIINKNSHNIFYVKGVNIKKNGVISIYYTDYTTADETTVDLKYIDGILIPDGYYYIGKTKDNSGNESIVISQNKDEEINDSSTTQYVWQKQIAEINKIPDSVKLSSDQNKDKFLQSVNIYKGYFKNKNKTSDIDVIYLEVKENKWSEVYSKNTKYIDSNGEEAYIPAGFRVSLSKGTNDVKNGLLITDNIDENGNSTGNEFIWIPINTNYERNISYNKEEISSTAYTITGYLPEGIAPTNETSDNNETAEKEQVKKYGGFYIARYESGQENLKTVNEKTSALTTEVTPVSKKNTVVYNWISQESAKQVSKKMYNNDNVKSALCSGIQWDMVMKFINGKSDGKQQIVDVETAVFTDNEYNRHTGNIEKTGNNEADKVANIYDLEGNFYEYVAENSDAPNTLGKAIVRGGIFDNKTQSMSYRQCHTGTAKKGITFRTVLYLI